MCIRDSFTVDEDTQRIYPRIQFDAALKMMLGVVRPTAEAGADLHHTEGHCLFYTYNGAYYPTQDAWQGKQVIPPVASWFQRAPNRSPGPRNSGKGAQTPFRRPS